MIVHQNQYGVYLGHGWLYELAVRDKVRVSYSVNGAKGNVHMASFNGRFKSENRLLFWEQDDLASLKEVVSQRIRYYNHVRRHSALGNKSPIRYLKEKGRIPGWDVSANYPSKWFEKWESYPRSSEAIL